VIWFCWPGPLLYLGNPDEQFIRRGAPPVKDTRPINFKFNYSNAKQVDFEAEKKRCQRTLYDWESFPDQPLDIRVAELGRNIAYLGQLFSSLSHVHRKYERCSLHSNAEKDHDESHKGGDYQDVDLRRSSLSN
jgi:hypothetical protein